jgi:hypothetical protein
MGMWRSNKGCISLIFLFDIVGIFAFTGNKSFVLFAADTRANSFTHFASLP